MKPRTPALSLLEQVREALVGAYDFHVHTAPDAHAARWYDDIEYAREASAAGMGGAVLKNHYTYTGDRAELVRQIVPEFDVYGGVCLDAAVGGLNAWAVDAALRSSDGLCRIVWLPTISALNYPNRVAKHAGPGIAVLTDDGKVRPEIYEIFEILRGTSCSLATGHLTFDEQLIILREAHSFGLERLIVTHADAAYLDLTPERQAELGRYAILEHAAMHYLSKTVKRSPEEVVAGIRAVGVGRCILSTDLGQQHQADPIRGLMTFCAGLLRDGFRPDELRTMMCANPRALVSG